MTHKYRLNHISIFMHEASQDRYGKPQYEAVLSILDYKLIQRIYQLCIDVTLN